MIFRFDPRRRLPDGLFIGDIELDETRVGAVVAQ